MLLGEYVYFCNGYNPIHVHTVMVVGVAGTYAGMTSCLTFAAFQNVVNMSLQCFQVHPLPSIF